MRWRLLFLVVAATCCSAPLSWLDRGDRAFAVGQQRAVDPAFARGGDALLAGFPARIADRGVAAGDALLFGFESFGPDGVARRYVLFEALASDALPRRPVTLRAEVDGRRELDCRTQRVRVRTFDELGRPLGDTTSDVAAEVLELGLFPWARAEDRGRFRGPLGFLAAGRSAPPADMQHHAFGWAIAIELLDGFLGNAALTGLVASLSVWPTWYERLLLVGARLELDTGARWARLVRQPIDGLPAGELAYETQLELSRGGAPILVVHADIVPAAGPLALTAGIVAMAGYRGTDPELRFVARLLAARQAAAP